MDDVLPLIDVRFNNLCVLLIFSFTVVHRVFIQRKLENTCIKKFSIKTVPNFQNFKNFELFLKNVKKANIRREFSKNSSNVFRKKRKEKKKKGSGNQAKRFEFFIASRRIFTLKEFKRESANDCVKFIRKQHERLCSRVVKTVEIGGNNAGDGKLIGFRGVSGEFDSRLIGYFLLSPVRAWITIEKGRGIFRSPISLDFSPSFSLMEY